MRLEAESIKIGELKNLASESLDGLYQRLSSSSLGLTSTQAAAYRKTYGSNQILVGLHESVIIKFLKLFSVPFDL